MSAPRRRRDRSRTPPDSRGNSGPSGAEFAHVVDFAAVVDAEQFAVDRQVLLAAEFVDRVEGPLELSAAGGGPFLEGASDGFELPLHLVNRLRVLAPLLAELAEQLQDLLAGLFDHEVVERLPDDPEEGEQG